MPRWWSVLALVATGSAALAQPAPPGGGSYFGAGAGQAFTPDAVFTAPPPPKPVAPPDPPPDGPPPAPPPKVWSGSADIGLNGASGNSDLFNVRSGFAAQRKTERNLFVSDFLLTYAKQDGVVSTQQAIYNARDEILFPGSNWSLFAANQIEYDEFRDYRFRVGLYAGAGYAVYNTPDLLFKLRGGAGAQWEVGEDGLQDNWVPELVFGYDFRWRWNDRSSFVSTLDFYPRVDDFAVYRVRTRAAYECVLDPATCTILRIGVQDRYDSNPGTSKRNDLNYFATLGVKF